MVLLQIVYIVFSPVITDGMTTFLKHIIDEHHWLFKHFTARKYLPKYHFMTHYLRCIKNIGLILHIWSMRYEAKHNSFQGYT